jgi:flagellar biosynthesis protein FlhB
MTDTKDNFWTRLKKELENNFFNFLRQLPFYVICWGIGFYLLRQSAIRISLDNEKTITTQLLFLLLFSIFLLLLPFAKKIKFLNVFEIEREIKETKQEVRDFKSEIRQSLSILTNSLNASIG